MRKLTYQIIRISCLVLFLKVAALAQVPVWSVNPADFTNNMSLIAQVHLGGNEENGQDNVLGAFVNNEVRGVATPTMINGSAYYFLTIHSNIAVGEIVNFKVILSSANAVFQSLEEVVFYKSSQIGDYPNGYVINISPSDDFPISLLPIPPVTTLVNYPFQVIDLNDYLVSQDNDPVAWTVANSSNLSASIGPGNLLTVTPSWPGWLGTEDVQVTATEIGTASAHSASQVISFTRQTDYSSPVFGEIPVQFVQSDQPVPSGDLNEYLIYDGPCLNYSFQFIFPEGTEPAPIWNQPRSNSPTMNLLIRANYGGQEVSGVSNKLAGFVNGQLAGVASPQNVMGENFYFLTLANKGPGEVTLKLYDANHQYIHEKALGIDFSPAAANGNISTPLTVEFAPIAIDLAPDGSWTSTIVDPDYFGEQHVLFFVEDCEYPDKNDSKEVVFIFAQCPEMTIGLPSDSGLCFEAPAEIGDVIWFLDGAEVGAGSYFAAFELGSYHYEGVSPTGCPNVKSCPIEVDDSNLTPPANGPYFPPTTWPTPPDCGGVQLTEIMVDNSSPTAICKEITIVLDQNGHAILEAADVDDGSFSNCGAATLLLSQYDFNCQEIGLNQVVLTIEDAAGRTGTCNTAVTVQDNTPPTVICKNHTASLAANGLTSFSPADFFQSGADNCSLVNLATVSPSTFDCANLGAHTVTLTVNDGNGNTNTCTAIVTVVDSEAPVPICPATTPVVMLDANGNGTLPANIGDGSSTDNCSAIETSPTMDFDCDAIGPHTVFLTASDGTNSSTAICLFNVVDNVAPLANCTIQTLNASFDANGDYTIDPNDLNDGSSDACGIMSMTANPATLNCQHEGLNTITLSVTDNNGNNSTCTAMLEMAEFLAILGVTATPEGCIGAGDGSITVNAIAGGGQVGYSIDGGNNFQFNNTFSGLQPGSYEIILKVFSIPNTCEKSVTAVVAVGGGPITWYKDNDNDGYSDGTTQVSCAQPSGYKALADLLGPETDCNDNDPLQKPGQVWFPDIDSDNYGGATTITQCTRPVGYKAITELAGPETDCDDVDPAINPGAVEICNGIDDNCDGQVDEGVGGGLTYTGNVVFSSQAALDDWSPCYSIIVGNVTISGNNVHDLNPLVNLIKITGNLAIQSTDITKMEGLDNLDSLGGTLNIFSNSKLKTLDGLDSLSAVNGSLFMYYNFKLDECCAIYDLLDNNGVLGSKVIYFNKTGCNSITEINTVCVLAANPLVGGASLGTKPVRPLNVKEVTVFPNPTRGAFNVVIPDGWSEGKLKMVDFQGRVVLIQEIIENELVYKIDERGLSAGIYLMMVESPSQPTQNKRIVIE